MRTIKSCLKEVQELQYRCFGKFTMWITMSKGDGDPFFNVSVFENGNEKNKEFHFYSFNKSEWNDNIARIKEWLGYE